MGGRPPEDLDADEEQLLIDLYGSRWKLHFGIIDQNQILSRQDEATLEEVYGEQWARILNYKKPVAKNIVVADKPKTRVFVPLSQIRNYKK